MNDAILVTLDVEYPEAIMFNGAAYIRKPDPEHVWKFGDWARLRKDTIYPEEIVFVIGPKDRFGNVPFIFKGNIKKGNYTGTHPRFLEYISSATIPE